MDQTSTEKHIARASHYRSQWDGHSNISVRSNQRESRHKIVAIVNNWVGYRPAMARKELVPVLSINFLSDQFGKED